MENLEQLQEYYNLQLKDFYNPSFDQLTNNQLKRINNSFRFKIAKSSNVNLYNDHKNIFKLVNGNEPID